MEGGVLLRPKPKWRDLDLYTKLLLGIVLCTVITLAVSSTILFVFFNRIALKQVYRSDLSNLTQTSKEVLSMTDSAQTLTYQLYRNSNLAKLMFYPEPNIYDLVAAMRELSNYINSMPYIDSIYVYNPTSADIYVAASYGQNGVLAKSELVDKDIFKMLENYKDFKPFMPIPRSVPVDQAGLEKKGVYTYLCFDAIGSDKTVNSAVIVNIDVQWINKDIGSHHGSNDGNSFIIDSEGHLLSGDNLTLGGSGDTTQSLINKIVSQQSSGYLVSHVKGQKSLITYTEPDALDWRYVRITPYRSITKQVNEIRQMTLLITFVILVGGLMFSWFLSRRLYVPIDRMANRVQMLEVEKRNSLFTIRQNFLRNLVLGREAINPKTLRARLAAMGISFNIQGEYRIALLQIDQYASFAEAHHADMHVYRYAIMNIASELAMQAYQTETVDLDKDGILLLLGLSSASEEQMDEAYLRSMFMQIQKAVKEHLRIDVTISYTGTESQFLYVHSLYKQVLETARYRFFTGNQALLDANATLVPKTKEYSYSLEKEKKMIEAMMTGKIDEAKKLYAATMEETRRYPIQTAYTVLAQLKLAFVNLLRTLQKNHGVEFEHNPEWTMPSLEAIETQDEADRLIYAMLEEVKEKVGDRRKVRHDDLVHQVNERIERHYYDPSLSLNWLADELDLSPSYVGRMYKQLTMKTIVDVINSVRMERAIALLGQTHLSIAEVAERTGFTNASYFYRMFKKYFGLTPTDYRKGNSEQVDGMDADGKGLSEEEIG